MVDQDIKDANSARDDYALQQSVIASLSQHALLGGTLQQLFDEATRLVRETLQASDAGYAMLVNAPVIVTDFSSEQRLRSLIAKRWELQSGVTVVIHGREHPFGVLAIHDAQPRQFSHDEVDFLQSVANILGLAIGQRQTEEEVRARERYFRSLIEDTNDLIVVLDLEHRYQFVSASAERILGYRVEELVGRSTLDFCHPEEHEAVTQDLRRIAEQGAEERMLRARLRHKDGSWRVVEWSGRSALDIKGASCLVAN